MLILEKKQHFATLEKNDTLKFVTSYVIKMDDKPIKFSLLLIESTPDWMSRYSYVAKCPGGESKS